MHARLAVARVRPGTAAKARAVWQDLLDDYRAQGCMGLLSLHDPEQDRAVTITLWASSEEADRAAVELRPRAVAAFADLLVEPPTLEPYDVLLDVRGL